VDCLCMYSPCPKPLSRFPGAPLGTGAALRSPLQEPSLLQAEPAQHHSELRLPLAAGLADPRHRLCGMWLSPSHSPRGLVHW
uniref:Uncharacterized protein n=1 Tax=Strigops habroptila TaxID=2489341 RepID=A0A672TVS8_STRHB